MEDPQAIIGRLGHEYNELIINVADEISKELELAPPNSQIIYINKKAKLLSTAAGAFIPTKQRELQYKAVTFLSDWQVIRGAESTSVQNSIKITLDRVTFCEFYVALRSEPEEIAERPKWEHNVMSYRGVNYVPEEERRKLLSYIWSQPRSRKQVTGYMSMSEERLRDLVSTFNQTMTSKDFPVKIRRRSQVFREFK